MLSVTNPRTMNDSQNIRHWLIPLLVSLAITAGGVLLSTGATTEKLTNAEDNIRKLQDNTVTQKQFDDLRMDVKEIKQDIKDLSKKR